VSNPATIAPVKVVDYDPDWPRIFQRLRDQIWPSLQDAALAIEHVGSTAVKGMAGKPVIDLDVVISSRTQLPVVTARLETLGYKQRGNLGIDDREAFAPPTDQPAHHLYVCSRNSLSLRNHITVRDYLRTHRSQAIVYSNLKKQLAERFSNQREFYGKGKTDFILSILKQCEFSAEELDSIKCAQV